MISIAMFNNKGGVGKTTLVCNLASYIACMGKKVLVIDADPQCNATAYCFEDRILESIYSATNAIQTIQDIIRPVANGEGYIGSISPQKRIENFQFDIIPGNPNLAMFEDTLATDWNSTQGGDIRGIRTTLTFRDLLNKCDNYDFVFFDMSPSLGALNRSILLGCDFFLTPLSCDIFSLMAIDNIGQSITKWNEKFRRGYENSSIQLEDLFGEQIAQVRFLGFVIQQYTKKTVEGQQRPVKAYETIMTKIPDIINEKMTRVINAGLPEIVSYELGVIPNFNSVIPLSQTNHKPVFNLKSGDGIVGAHFTKVKEYEHVMESIYSNIVNNIFLLEGSND